jgi:anti-sigma regulatory factor (Ser/Thr protein kinase)
MCGDSAVAPEPLATGAVAAGERFHHESLLYSGDDGFLSGTVRFIPDALEAEPVLVAVSKARIDSLKEALSSDAARVAFTDMHVLGSNPARIIPAWHRFLSDHAPDGRSVRGIGEPIWAGRGDAELTECQRHEALLNVAFDGGQAWRLLCPYDLDALDDDVIRAAEESHPFLARDGVTRTSDAYSPIDSGSGPFDGELPAPLSQPDESDFTSERLEDLRRTVASAAADARLPHDRTDDLVLAVNELATNSIYHGGGQGSLRVWRQDETLFCEVSDRGWITEPLVGRIHPTPEQWSGRGLWLVNQLCDLVQIRSHEAGSVVRVHMRLP